jgi:predicted RNA polymerase sigma factor
MIDRLDHAAQDLLRDLAPQVLGLLLRRYGDFGGCEDAVQEALIAAATQWPKQGMVYLIFNEGYAASAGDDLFRVDLSNEAIRVARLLAHLLPHEPEVSGLLALMLLTDARRAARAGPNGELIPLDEQVRSMWDRVRISEGNEILQRALALGAAGPYQIQEAIAALHDEAPSTEATDWAQIRGLYELLLRMHDSPMARLSHAIAFAMVEGPAAGLAALDEIAADGRLSTWPDDSTMPRAWHVTRVRRLVPEGTARSRQITGLSPPEPCRKLAPLNPHTSSASPSACRYRELFRLLEDRHDRPNENSRPARHGHPSPLGCASDCAGGAVAANRPH